MEEEIRQKVKRNISKNSSRGLNNSSFKKSRIVRNNSNPSDEISANGNNDNPATGYINGNLNNAKFPSKSITKPTRKKMSTSDTNSSFGENYSTSPYMTNEKEYMLNWINYPGSTESTGKIQK